MIIPSDHPETRILCLFWLLQTKVLFCLLLQSMACCLWSGTTACGAISWYIFYRRVPTSVNYKSGY